MKGPVDSLNLLPSSSEMSSIVSVSEWEEGIEGNFPLHKAVTAGTDF
jgi:hypothetical protein